MRICAVLLLASAAVASAQEIRRAEPAPEVRRAEAIDPATYQNPGWMDRVPPPATPVPVATPLPMATPLPVATPMPLDPVERPVPTPTSPAPPVAEEAPEPADEGPAPAMDVPTENRSLLAANGFYRRKMYDMAVYEYEKYLIGEPGGDGREGALFRLGESHRILGNDRAARDAYIRLLTEFREGEFVGSGAYRLGELYYAEGNSGSALGMFEKAAANTREPAVKLTALFYQASALNKLGRSAQAARKYAEIARIEGENPYRDAAEFYLAEEAARTGRKQDAFTSYEKLSGSAEKAEMKAEATVKAAAIASELGRGARARELFEKALALPAIGDWRGVASLGLLRLAYQAGDYKAAAALSERDIAALPRPNVAEALLLSANARRQLGETQRALELYDRILREFPKSDAATQASFQRLVCLDATGAADLTAQLDAFLATSTDPKERAQATLLKAETVFKKGDYAAAAPLYASVLRDVLPARLRNQARYKLGWCEIQLQKYPEAVKTFTVYIQDNPQGAQLPAALAQRAFALQQAKAYGEALADFERILTEFPKAKEREIAMQQKALILGQQADYDAMAKTFAQLLEEYPKSKAAAQAEFWIGWAASERKDWPAAIEHLAKARELDEKAFGERATLRIVLAHHALEDLDATAAEVAKMKIENVPPGVLLWLGSKYVEAGDYGKAEIFLSPPAVQGAAAASNPELLLVLAETRIAQKKFTAARDPIRQYLAAARDPLSRAKGLIASARVSLGTGNYEDASKILDEALLLQPEGRYNAEARLLGGEVQMLRGDYDGAARAFMTISVLYDEPEVTPQALERAAAAYKKAGKSADAARALAEREQRYPKGGGAQVE